jgi:hypothetical protein
MRLGRKRLLAGCFLLALVTAPSGFRPGSSGVAPAAVAAQEDVEPEWAKQDADRRARAVGRGLTQLRRGMTRKDVEAIVGPPDYEPAVRMYDWNRYSVTYDAIFEPAPGLQWPAGRLSLMSVRYETVDGVDWFLYVDGPHRPVCP